MIEGKDEDWETPLVDYYAMPTPIGMLPTRQADGLTLNVTVCADDPEREVVTLLLYSTTLETGLLMPLSPETVSAISLALAANCRPPSKDKMQ